MGTYKHLHRKSSASITPANRTSHRLHSSRQITPAPVPLSEHLSPQQQAQPTQSSRLRYSLADIPIFPPERDNRASLPNNLKAGIENLSGIAMDDVHVHYNSSKPAELQALAYTQGPEIHVGPGQERHLAHEAWHVVQQKQGRVKPTLQIRGREMNDDEQLEGEAARMGSQAEKGLLMPIAPLLSRPLLAAPTPVIQGFLTQKMKNFLTALRQAKLQSTAKGGLVKKNLTQNQINEIIEEFFQRYQKVEDTEENRNVIRQELLGREAQGAPVQEEEKVPIIAAPEKITKLDNAEKKAIKYFQGVIDKGEGNTDFDTLITNMEKYPRLLANFCEETETIVPPGAKQGNRVWKLDLAKLKGLGAAIRKRLDVFTRRPDTPRHGNLERQLPTYKEPEMEKHFKERKPDENYYEYSIGGGQGLRIVVDAVHRRVYLSLHYSSFFALYDEGHPLGGKILADAIQQHAELSQIEELALK